jgi:hypothetical protein
MRLEQSQVRVSQLQQTVHELRSALADSKARALDGDTANVDRRIVGQLFVAFMSMQRRTGQFRGFGSSKAKDALLVIASVLSLSAQEREAIGIDDIVEGPADGPTGAVLTSAVRSVGGFMSSWLGSSSSSGSAGAAPVPIVPAVAADGSTPSLGAAFVQFLLAETAREAEAETKTEAPAAVSAPAIATTTPKAVADVSPPATPATNTATA